jgi:uncharacterized protein (DUF2062 family)
MNLSRLQKFYYLKFLRIKGDPKSIAWGSFIGAFIGTLPVMPFHTIGIIALCMLTRNSTMAGLLASLAISNPLTYIPIYYACLKIGNFLTPYEMSWSKISAILDIIVSGHGFRESVEMLSNLGSEIFIVMLTGGFVLALPTAIFCYFFTLNLFIKIRARRRRRQILHNKRK